MRKLIISLAAIAAAASACGRKPAEPEVVVPVQVAPVIHGSIRRIVTADAILYPRDQAGISPKISAPVKRLLVQRGDRVKAGQLLAELENRDLAAAATASKGQLTQSESNYRSTTGAGVPEQLTKAQTDLDAAKQALEASKNLLDSREQLFKQGALARKLVDEAQVAYAQARAQYQTAEQHLAALQNVSRDEQLKAAAAQLESARGQYEAAQAQLDYSQIRSPIAGVVTDRPVYAGEMVNPGSALVTVMDLSAVVARISMAQAQARNIKVGAAAELTASGGGDAVSGRVTIVSPAVDQNSTTVQVWVQADNGDGRFRAGESVHVAIVAETIDGALVVPASALLPSDEGGSMVIVVDDKNVAHHAKVDVGVTEEDLVQVVSGVADGQRVVTTGGVGLEDKAKVRILKPGEKRPGEEEEKDEDKGGAS